MQKSRKWKANATEKVGYLLFGIDGEMGYAHDRRMNIIKLTAVVGVCLGVLTFQGVAQTPEAPSTPAAAAAVPAVDKDGFLKKVEVAINPEAEGDRKELIRKGLAALADLNAAGTKPEDSLSQAQANGKLSGDKTEKMSKMLLEMWNLNTARMSEPATLDALRQGKMPDPALKRP